MHIHETCSPFTEPIRVSENTGPPDPPPKYPVQVEDAHTDSKQRFSELELRPDGQAEQHLHLDSETETLNFEKQIARETVRYKSEGHHEEKQDSQTDDLGKFNLQTPADEEDTVRHKLEVSHDESPAVMPIDTVQDRHLPSMQEQSIVSIV